MEGAQKRMGGAPGEPAAAAAGGATAPLSIAHRNGSSSSVVAEAVAAAWDVGFSVVDPAAGGSLYGAVPAMCVCVCVVPCAAAAAVW